VKLRRATLTAPGADDATSARLFTRVRRTEEISARVARRIEPILVVATLLVVPVLILEIAEVPAPWSTAALIGDWLIWLAFLGEVILMLAIVPDRKAWARAHVLDLAIVVLTPPFATIMLQSVRALRLVRIARLVRLARFATLARSVFSLAGVRYAAVLALLTTIVGAQAFATSENISTGRGLYWAITTMTTVGYGDITPTTTTGEVTAVAVMLVGIGFVAIITGAVAQRFVQVGQEAEIDKSDQILEQVGLLAARLEAIEDALRVHELPRAPREAPRAA